jgi:mRNA-degrading endonuclease YafQ of YafQ-DinJ toxin-antitoxin module
MKKKDNTVSIKEAINKLIDTYKLRGKLQETELAGKWEDLMGPIIARKTETIYIRDEVLYIRLTSSALRQELGFSRQLIIEKVNEVLKHQGAVKEVKFL